MMVATWQCPICTAPITNAAAPLRRRARAHFIIVHSRGTSKAQLDAWFKFFNALPGKGRGA